MYFSDMKCDILELRGDNYKVWKESILRHLGWMDIDYAIRKIELAPITETSVLDEAIDDQFVSSDKALATLIMRFTSQKLTGLNGVRENITQMRDIAA
ncbi:UNVERIFIED_CONTAM: hypothetical protein Scaly_1158600 [Sesamum calycinum]|uniref:DUF4219 domain-containing protein n=1 Tax=Sesamum calycinum TaxID=2727403 RepID=A0AAW2Q2E6_9LAMI